MNLNKGSKIDLARYRIGVAKEKLQADYGDYVIFTKEDAQHQIANATKFIQAVEALLNKMLEES